MVQIGNQTENIQSQIHKVYLRMRADSGPVGRSFVLVAAAAEALAAVLAGLMAEEAAAQHEEAVIEEALLLVALPDMIHGRRPPVIALRVRRFVLVRLPRRRLPLGRGGGELEVGI